MKFLSQEWCDATRAMAADQLVCPGVTARIQYVVTGGPDGDVRCSWELEDGRLAASRPGTITDPDVTITAPALEWARIVRGELDASVAFMQGTMKVSGSMGVFLRLLPLTQSPAGAELRDRVREITEP